MDTLEKDSPDMTISGDNQPPPSGRGPWWLAAIGGSSGITALVLQDHQAAWVILVAFNAWLIHNVVITWIKDGSPGKHG
jgi:hypothetical protein